MFTPQEDYPPPRNRLQSVFEHMPLTEEENFRKPRQLPELVPYEEIPRATTEPAKHFHAATAEQQLRERSETEGVTGLLGNEKPKKFLTFVNSRKIRRLIRMLVGVLRRHEFYFHCRSLSLETIVALAASRFTYMLKHVRALQNMKN